MRKVQTLILGLALTAAVGNCFPKDTDTNSRLPPLPKITVQDILPGIRDQVQNAYSAVQAHPRDASANGRLAMILHVYNQPKAATACYQRAHHLDPNSFRWLFYLGMVEQAQGQYDQAASTFQRALRLNPQYIPAKLALADSLRGTAHWDESRTIYLAVLRTDPENATAHYGLGRVLVALGNKEEAMKSFAKACDLYPNYGAAHYALALAYRAQGDAQKAEEQFALYRKNASEAPPVADSLMQEVQALNESGLSEIRTGMALERAGRLEDSAAAHERALELDSKLVQAHINLISLYGRLGQNDKATQHYFAAIRADPNAAEAYYNYGVLELSLGKPTEAEEGFRKSVELNPYHAEAHNNLGAILEQKGMWQEAEREFGQAIQNKPNFRLARFHLGRILVNEGKYQEGIAQLLNTISPEDEQTPTYLYALGAAYARAGQRQPSLDYIRKAREQSQRLGQTELLRSIDKDLRLLEAGEAAH
jgi:tetratricopeptide (TPR) repeat protein